MEGPGRRNDRVRPPGTAPCVAAAFFLAAACSDGKGGGSSGSGVDDFWNPDVRGVPRLVQADYIDLPRIARISRFRSAEGHDYSDSVEHCRSMKHYFQPAGAVGMPNNPSWTTVEIRSPVTGTVRRLMPEGNGVGVQVSLAPDVSPAFDVAIFHVAAEASLAVGSRVTAGQRLGRHASDDTMSDIAVRAATDRESSRLVSYFDATTDEVFAAYSARGVSSRSEFVVDRAARDADPLSCAGDRFASAGSLAGWVELR